jgi:transposase
MLTSAVGYSGLKTRSLRALVTADTEFYKQRVEILTTISGKGTVVAMELLLEFQDINRFQRADRLAAYVGLTLSIYQCR